MAPVYTLVVCAMLAGSMTSAAAKRVAPCCIPDQMEGTQSMSTGYSVGDQSGMVVVMTQVSYDATIMKVAASETVMDNGQTSHTKYIADHPRKRLYMIKDDKCTYSTLDEPFERSCVPDDAVHSGTSDYGPPANKLVVEAWTLQTGTGPDDSYNVWFTTSQTDCVPVTVAITGTSQGANFMTGGAFTGLTDGIKDPSVFEPPTSCTPEDQQTSRSVIESLGQYLLFGRPGSSAPKEPKLKPAQGKDDGTKNVGLKP